MRKELSDIKDDICLFFINGGIRNYEFVIYNQEKSKVLAYIYIFKKGRKWCISKVVAIQNYGPLIYDIAMMFIYPEYLLPSRYSVSKSAKKIWRFYYESRPDVEKKKLEKSSTLFLKEYEGKHFYLNFCYRKEKCKNLDLKLRRGLKFFENGRIHRYEINIQASDLFIKYFRS